MKRIVVIIGYILVAELVYSQSFISESKLWSNLFHGTEYGSPYESFYIKMTGDSVISDQSYCKVYRSDDSLHLHWFFEGLIRETDTGTVYYRDIENATESLLYDFGLEELDSIQAMDGENFYFYVDSVKTKPFGIYNELKKHIYMSRNHRYNSDIWIEGVGSIFGVLTDLSFHLTVGEGRSLLCFIENDSLKYVSTNSCFITGTYTFSKHIDHIEPIKVINNAGELIIMQNGTQHVKVNIRIFDLNGRQLFIREVSEMDIFSLNTSDLNTGLYIFLIQVGEFFTSGKFLIY